jgi:hypothetical protein
MSTRSSWHLSRLRIKSYRGLVMHLNGVISDYEARITLVDHGHVGPRLYTICLAVTITAHRARSLLYAERLVSCVT